MRETSSPPTSDRYVHSTAQPWGQGDLLTSYLRQVGAQYRPTLGPGRPPHLLPQTGMCTVQNNPQIRETSSPPTSDREVHSAEQPSDQGDLLTSYFRQVYAWCRTTLRPGRPPHFLLQIGMCTVQPNPGARDTSSPPTSEDRYVHSTAQPWGQGDLLTSYLRQVGAQCRTTLRPGRPPHLLPQTGRCTVQLNPGTRVSSSPPTSDRQVHSTTEPWDQGDLLTSYLRQVGARWCPAHFGLCTRDTLLLHWIKCRVAYSVNRSPHNPGPQGITQNHGMCTLLYMQLVSVLPGSSGPALDKVVLQGSGILSADSQIKATSCVTQLGPLSIATTNSHRTLKC